MENNIQKTELVVIGAGPGGYTAAFRAADLGIQVTLIDKSYNLGGVCLNKGCIPSKSLLDSSHHYEEAIHNFNHHGIEIGDKVKINFKQMIKRKSDVVEQTTKGIDFLMQKNKISVFEGLGSFIDKNTVRVEGKEKKEIKTKNIVIATGSKPGNLPFIKIDKERIITSTEALSLDEIPKNLLVIGGGVIGL